MPSLLVRLKKRADFLRVAGQRRKWAAPGLILQAAVTPKGAAGVQSVGPDSADGVLRVGFTCSKKVGNSVERNRARRRLKAAVAELFPQAALPGNDYVVIGRQETLKRNYSLLLQDLRTALKRLGALRPAEGPAEARAQQGEESGP